MLQLVCGYVWTRIAYFDLRLQMFIVKEGLLINRIERKDGICENALRFSRQCATLLSSQNLNKFMTLISFLMGKIFCSSPWLVFFLHRISLAVTSPRMLVYFITTEEGHSRLFNLISFIFFI